MGTLARSVVRAQQIGLLFLVAFPALVTAQAPLVQPAGIGTPAPATTTTTAADPAKQKAISALIEVLNPQQSIQHMVPTARTQFRAVLRQMLPFTVDDKLLDKIAQDFASEMTTLDFTSLTAKFYDENFSQSDIEAITAFHKSPAGQKLLVATPKLAQASMAFGQKEGERIGQMVLNRYMAEIRKSLPPPPTPGAPKP